MESRELIFQFEKKRNYFRIKSLLGKMLSIVGLTLLSPLFLIVFLSLKLTEPKAPVLFKQIRNGKDTKEFNIYKFRTMHVDAEDRMEELVQFNEVEGAMFKMKNDPRVTKIGRFLRKTSIDELPQLINVLKGEMALVGPRPPLPRELTEYSDYDMQRLMVTPGCTGLWQVSGRNELSFDEMVELDLTYIKKMSLWMDLKIMLKTFFVMVVPKNGY
ncbi:sugar transferase [Carnobacterium divergens]|uniref:Sugar transferase n=1 Tax=Carnobacterium divergens TaxID=2748 RepID=A0AAW8R5U7_CARDV|nr:sugar transferase [Carnobacterium divergens]MDT1957206.1 sugar transferase [Carnobacterium divergens]MDT1973176.1 sugar transferase [Carnobacterium divergens]MDT2012240.1 sugar transferase [Carnobacterium divergens]